MTTVTIEEAQANLKELIHQMGPGEELIITENPPAVAKLVSESPPTRKQRPGPGLLQGRVNPQKCLAEPQRHWQTSQEPANFRM
jgi:antitoxin (DNA-binding transcriptional repressor) of toxin-antitoxin stability system